MSDWGLYCDAFGLTRSEAKIYALLSDGTPHSTAECLAALGKRPSDVCGMLVAVHVGNLRRKMKARGQNIFILKRGAFSFYCIEARVHRDAGVPSLSAELSA